MKRTVPADELARLDSIRTDAIDERAREQARLLDRAPDVTTDPLGAIAWVAGVLDGDDTATVLMDLIQQAKYEQRREWREIVAALGRDPESNTDVHNVSQRHRRRSRP